MWDIVLKDQDTRTKHSNKEPTDDSVKIWFITAFEIWIFYKAELNQIWAPNERNL
jgi:hypothetical protein